MMPGSRWIPLCSFACLVFLVGCVMQPKLTEDRATYCVRQTFEFQNRTRGVVYPIRCMNETENDEIIVSVFEEGPDAFHRLATFRVQKNRRIDVWDLEKDDWRTVGSCD